MQTAKNKITPLIDRVRAAADTDENRRRLSLFRIPNLGVDRFLPGQVGSLPVIVYPELNFWNGLLGFSLKDYYHDPLVYLESQLRIILKQWEEVPDDRPISKVISIRLGVALVPSLWGAKTVFPEDNNPWYVVDPLVTSAPELKSIAPGDFRSAGLMKRCHEFYGVIRHALPDDFRVEFPLWDFSPLGVAHTLYGTDRFLMQAILNPADAAQALSFITEVQGKWYQDRAEFLGEPLREVTLGEDDVNVPMLSPKLYRDLILPTELRLKEICGAVSYWHSCGNTTPFFQDIALTQPWLMDVSYASGQKEAQEVFPPSVAIECNLNGMAVMAGDFQSQLKRAEEAKRLFADRCACLIISGIAAKHKPKEDLGLVKDFMAELRKCFGVSFC